MVASPKTSSIYIASPEGDTGKSTIALGAMNLLTSTGWTIGVFRPIPRTWGEQRDYILELLIEQATADLDYDDCVGVSYEKVHEDPDAAIAEIVSRYHAVADKCDFVLILGSDYTDVSSPTELSFNARIAANLGASILLAVKALDRTPEQVVSVAEQSMAEIRANHAHTSSVIANRCDPGQLDAVRQALATATGLPVWVLPEEPVLTAPTVGELMEAMDGKLLWGDPELLSREAMDVLVAGMTAEHSLERVTEGVAVIAPGDRSEVLLAMVNAHRANGFPSLAGIILNGGYAPHPMTAALVDGLKPTLPIVAVQQGTYESARIAAKTRGRVGPGSARKVDLAVALTERYVVSEDLMEALQVSNPGVVTPQMFEYHLIARARADRKRIVLPEGDDDRILRAAGRLLQREVADLTILGQESRVRARAAELGVDLGDTDVIDPKRATDLIDKFAQTYYELRKHKGMTLERAAETVVDVSYFGTMMVYLGMADGMVSGAAHTTAHTIRPSFEIIKTKPGVSTVSSIFLMCLADKVLAYGDCAVVPDPTETQLADIAISSAQTASQFGIDPRVAMLSYSTGESGTGADVDKVRAATGLVRERAPKLLVEGPIQYDAAVDPGVAASKMPDSAVAGKATVLVFPDLNTGNNTYKAVQRSAGAVAIGPVLQGLNAPINDLSRGALVEDIVNTVAITAIQAQAFAAEKAGKADAKETQA
ncbi:Phosphate acetyltransferase OS=Tsukamurella paurometabola (strain ATCC 8368 / DSM / CCUG 35730/ CIP 100753 / JCM 10117 / KCTC 9821 / NBRC 16120 / NCIMB 702349 / NCTC 13040) OX=521096 GN=Tpau_3762 PE=3 SV=1 [Tsukamurella paurometabola]|uniref:Phosphate acetyltransferase n=1 Tax=Tsukamurella paurometabola (strain ATCC 8368 / DSM 20162 / CCUG 35730 / CIP 100753 / JCM 10117 / KCTC 9821 / NBRC 16120 / NCIMB 702349 / NCTC 13040) TaxID=521096 RepID=D5UYN7_TSUPD|nr:phosphate acetyltransferase [Tsukamurella paurometabola]ADG80340.1 phosphate acetyltransferase [Tsukamurella paurometabola DSM 20162]SUP39299.1 Phosphate acetyltransferase [Tsukamurella paurometabola]